MTNAVDGGAAGCASHGGRLRWRAAAEPRVRRWWLAGALAVALTAYYVCSHVYAWNDRRILLRDGRHVDAFVADSPDHDMHRRGQTAEPFWVVVLTFEQNGLPVRVTGELTDRTTPIPLQTTVPIRVDPHDPMRWTYESPLPQLWQALGGLALLGPLTLALFGVAFARWRRVVEVWRAGDAATAIVHVTRSPALAPDSTLCRVVIDAGAGATGKLVTAYVPRSANQNVGDQIEVRFIPGRPGEALAASWFAR